MPMDDNYLLQDDYRPNVFNGIPQKIKPLGYQSPPPHTHIFTGHHSNKIRMFLYLENFLKVKWFTGLDVSITVTSFLEHSYTDFYQRGIVNV